LFELNFNDQRYLPFEFMGAVSCWRIELPPENNYFEMGSLTDTIIRLNYTAREGGERLRRAASAAAQRYLPGDGWRFLDVRHEFPDAWQLFRDCPRGDKWERRLRLRLDRKMLPFVPGAREIWIDRLAILLSTDEYEDCNCPKSEGCPCPEHGEPACRIIEFAHGDEECDCERKVLCRASDEWPDLYCGIFDTRIGPLGGRGHHAEAEFRFHAATGEVEHVYLFCHVRTQSRLAGSFQFSQRPARPNGAPFFIAIA
jgi:Tc toxin complex TcA C-terminal TcB-binding domain